jgi:hypothetical protein
MRGLLYSDVQVIPFSRDTCNVWIINRPFSRNQFLRANRNHVGLHPGAIYMSNFKVNARGKFDHNLMSLSIATIISPDHGDGHNNVWMVCARTTQSQSAKTTVPSKKMPWISPTEPEWWTRTYSIASCQPCFLLAQASRNKHVIDAMQRQRSHLPPISLTLYQSRQKQHSYSL